MTFAHFSDIFDFPEETRWALRWRLWAAVALFLAAVSAVLAAVILVIWLVSQASTASLIGGAITALIIFGSGATAFIRRPRQRKTRIEYI